MNKPEIPKCFGTEEFSATSSICNSCRIFKKCKAVKFRKSKWSQIKSLFEGGVK
jgi:hypothetical protein